MLSTLTSTLQGQAQAPQPHLFTNLSHDSQRYRILTRSYNRTMGALDALEAMWVIVVLV